MKISRWLAFLLCSLLAVRGMAAEWNPVRVESREYVTLDNIAEFYGFPKPPPVDLTGHTMAGSPAAAGQPTAAAQPSPTPAAPAAGGVGKVAGASGKATDVAGTATNAGGTATNAGGAAAVASGTATGAGGKVAAVLKSATGPVTVVVDKSADEPSPISSAEPPPAEAGSKTILLDSGKSQLAVTVGLREAEINGVKHWLAFPVIYHDGKVLVSRLDLSKIIEPNLRPEFIEGMTPVTTVVLDPGHGGHDHGASSRFGNEKDFALDVALRARPLLEKAGYKVVMTRATDVFIPLEQRPAVANHIPNSIFVSIHFNSSSTNADARGFEIFSCAPRGAPATNDAGPRERDLREEPGNAVDMPSGALSCSVFHALLGQVPMVDRGVKHARFAVLRLCTQPAVLIECGFVSNNAESTLISSAAWRSRVAEAIVDGVEGYKGLAEAKTRPKVIADYRRATVTPGSGPVIQATP